MSESNADSLHHVCTRERLASDSPIVATIDGTSVAVFEVDGDLYALENTCPHQGGPLGEGRVEDKCVYCPWHGWEFDLETGQHAHGDDQATTYPVAVQDDDVFVQLE